MTERRKYDVEQYGEVLCWGVLHGFPLVSWVNCLRARKIKVFFGHFPGNHCQNREKMTVT